LFVVQDRYIGDGSDAVFMSKAVERKKERKKSDQEDTNGEKKFLMWPEAGFEFR
jgi:hypothetical protein